jgi:hypothetical protein
MKFLFKRLINYTSFHSDLNFSWHAHSSGGVSFTIQYYLSPTNNKSNRIAILSTWTLIRNMESLQNLAE